MAKNNKATNSPTDRPKVLTGTELHDAVSAFAEGSASPELRETLLQQIGKPVRRVIHRSPEQISQLRTAYESRKQRALEAASSDGKSFPSPRVSQ